MDRQQERARMVEQQLAARDISDERVLRACGAVPRECFLPDELAEFAYHDTPLAIGHEQTISQPYIVALTIQALKLRGDERVLEVGAGSGYAAAVLSRVAREVVTIERLEPLATLASERLERLGYDNVRVVCSDGTLGFPERAPYDAIAVAAGGPEVPKALLAQLAPGGRLVIPVGPAKSQVLMRIVRERDGRFREERLTEVRFVPLIGAQGWAPRKSALEPPVRSTPASLSALVRENAEPLAGIDQAQLGGLLDRIGDARVVLLGESTHGSSEFYRMRACITRALIERHGFDFVAAEADWPDAARIDDQVQGRERAPDPNFEPFSRFPTWLWRNEETRDFVTWLRMHNLQHGARVRGVGFHGLDLYSLFTSISLVLAYLDRVDERAARVARARYGLLTPWQSDPAAYGHAVLTGRYESSEEAVVAMLKDMLEQRLVYSQKDGSRFFDAAQNARVVAAAEHYYRAMYYRSAASWNLRDTHMFETLEALLSFYGPGSRGIVWAHNSHIGDARATQMSARGELNIGQLCRSQFGDAAYLVGFSTDHGSVAAASNWDEPMQKMRVRPALPGSYERIFHDSRVAAFTLPLRTPRREAVREELTTPRLERAIGVLYRPETELESHYFHASLPRQFDELVWFDETHAVTPLPARTKDSTELPETYPFGV